jgi:LSD1 subclass zinc finger protein
MTELQLFHCPNCGAPLDVPENASTVRCTYCNSSVVVPAALRETPEDETLWLREGAGQPNLGDIRLLMANDKKPEAVKLIMDQTGLGLKQAEDVADAIELSEKLGLPQSGLEVSPQAILTASDQNELMDLIQAGNKIEAIKVFRSKTGFGLRESKDAVEALERNDMTALMSAMIRGALSAQGSAQARPAMVISSAQIDSGFSGLSASTLKKTGAVAGCSVAGLIIFIIAVTVIPILYAFTVDGGPLASFWSQVNPAGFARVDLALEGEGIGPGQFDDPRAVAADHDGNIYVADYSTGRMQSFDSQGGFRWMVNLGDDVIIESMDIGSGDILYVTAQGVLRRFEAASGEELEPFTDPDRNYYFDDVAVAPDGRIALVYGGENLLVLNGDLETLFEIPQAVSSVTNDSELDSDVAIDALGNLFVLGSFNNLVLKYSPAGKYVNQFGGAGEGEEDGKFQAVGDLAVDNEGRVYVSDIFGIQVFDGDGRFTEQFKPVRYAHGMNFDLQDRLYIASNEPQVVRMVLRN